MTSIPSTRGRVITGGLVVALLIGGCTLSSGLSAEDRDAMAAANGRPADPDEYEVTNLTCTPDPDNSDVIIVTFKLTDTGTEQRLFEVDFLIEKNDGTYHNQHRTLFDRYLSPGESLDWDSVVVKGDDNPLDANCDIQILDSPFEVFDQ